MTTRDIEMSMEDLNKSELDEATPLSTGTTEIEKELKNENSNIKKAIEAYTSPPLPPRDNVATEEVKPVEEVQEEEEEHQQLDLDEPPLPPRNVEEQKNVVYHNDFIMYNNKRLKSILENKDKEDQEMTLVTIGELKEKYIESSSGNENEDMSLFVKEFPELSLHDLNHIEKYLIANDIQERQYLWPMLAFPSLSETTLVEETNSAVTEFLQSSEIADEQKLKRYSTILTTYLSCDPKIELINDLLVVLDTIDNVFADDVKYSYVIFKSLMSTNGLRELYVNDSEKDKLVYYCFDRYLEDNNSELFNHLAREGLLTYRFLGEWLRTLFQAQLSKDTNAKIIDLILLEGIEGILRIPLAILIGNELSLLKDKFDELFDFVQNKVEIGEHSQEFIVEAMDSIKLTPRMIMNYKNEYEEIHRLEREREEQYEYVKNKNLRLQEKVKKLEHDYTFLNREHVTIANELINNQLNIEDISQKNHKLRIEMMKLRKELDEQKRQNEIDKGLSVPKEMKKELDNILIKNSTVMSQNSKLQDKVAELERVAEDIKKATSEGRVYEDPTQHGWSGLKKKFQATQTQ